MPSPRTAVHGFIRPCLALFFTAFSSVLHAAPEDCLQDGGQATCTSPISVPGPWQHALCDDFAAYLGRVATWCAVMGGTWNGPYAPEACVGGDFVAGPPETRLYAYAETFEQRVHNVQSCPITGQDNGWLLPVQTLSSWNCWSGGPVVQNGIEVRNLREMLFSGQSYNATTQSCEGSWSERVIALRTRQLQVVCADGYMLRTSRFTGQLECYSTCPVGPLTPIPANDSCALSLEQGRGVDVNNACPSLTPEMQREANCLADKIVALRPGIAYTGPSATIRNVAYQNHLLQVWSKSQAIKRLTDAERQACTAVIADVTREMNWHGVVSPPSADGADAPHVNGRAIDIPEAVAETLAEQVTTDVTDIEDYIRSTLTNPPACNLRWGGRFKPVDRVHFQLP